MNDLVSIFYFLIVASLTVLVFFLVGIGLLIFRAGLEMNRDDSKDKDNNIWLHIINYYCIILHVYVTKPFPGDTVCCKVNEGLIIYSYAQKYEIIEDFDIINVIDGGYLVKVPVRLILTNSFIADQSRMKEYLIPKKFLGVSAHFITDSHIFSIKYRKDGECCDRCMEFFPMATRDEGGNFKCYLCKKYPYR